MELFLFILAMLGLAALVMPWVNLYRHNALEYRIRVLQNELRELRGKKGAPAVPEPPETKSAAKKVVKEEVWEDYGAPKEKKKRESKGFSFNFEQNIGARLPVWIGGIALIFAAFYMVKYSIETGLLGPLARISLGTVFGLVLLGAGQWIFGRKKQVANSHRIGQALIGAGLVSLYISLYAATNLYEFLGPTAGFVSMAAVTALGVVMSLRNGQPIAVFALVGGLLTPALVDTDAPNALALFGYLFLLFAGLMFVISRMGWWSLGVAALLGMYGWTAFWLTFVFTPVDSFVMIMFVLGMVIVAALFTRAMVKEVPKTQAPEKLLIVNHHWLNILSIAGGVIMVCLLDYHYHLSLFDWSVLGLMSLALMAMAFFKPKIYWWALWAKAAASFVLLQLWLEPQPLLETLMVLGGMGAVYVAVPHILMRQVSDPRHWAGLQVLSAIGIFLSAYFAVDLPAGFDAAFAGRFWGIASLILMACSIYQARSIGYAYQADKKIRDQLIGFYALGAMAFLSLGIVFEVPWEYLPLAFAAQIAAVFWVSRSVEIPYLYLLTGVLTLIFLGLNFQQIALFWDLIKNSLFDDNIGRLAKDWALDQPLMTLGPSVFFLGLGLWFDAQRDAEAPAGPLRIARKMLVVTTTGAGAMLIYYVLKDVFHDAEHPLSIASGFVLRGIITLVFVLYGLLLYRAAQSVSYSMLHKAGLWVFHLAIARVIWFDLIMANPMAPEFGVQYVGDAVFINGITLTYGLAAALCAWFSLRVLPQEENARSETYYKVLSFILVFAFISFSIRQYFHGGYLDRGIVSDTEIYAYSIGWLLLGIALLAGGIRYKSRMVRIASLLVMVLTVGKVFLYDARALEGLYRVFSFMGLGFSLIMLSFFYTRYVFGQSEAEKPAKS